MTTKRTQNMEYAIRDVVIPAKKLEKKGIKVLKLNIGDPCKYDFDAPDFAKEAYIQAIREGKSHYADSNGVVEAREAVVRREERVNCVRGEPDQVLITSGISETIAFLCGALIEEGGELLIPSPSYPQYLSFPKFFGGKSVEYCCDENNDWNPDLADLESKITPRTKAIAVINPNNPTGAVYSKDTLKGLVDLAVDHGTTLISDEIYDELTFTPYTCLSKLAQEAGASIVQMNGISKNFFAPGWRAGYSVFHNCNDLYEACFAQARNRLCSSTPAQYAMAKCLNGPRDFLEENKKKIYKRTELVDKRCKELGLECVKPKGTFYAFPKLGEGVDDKKWVLDLLKEKHVLTVFGSGFGEYGKGYFRVVTLPQEEVLEEAFDRIGEFLKEHK